MTRYGQFCPVSKATEIIGEKWMLLILRELHLGTHRFNDFQRAMCRISPTVLNKRLKELEEKGLVVRKPVSGRKGSEYRLTPMGKELAPLMEQLAIWGQKWARGQMSDDELDVELLMWDIQRRVDTAKLPDGDTTLMFIFQDLDKHKNWWLLVSGDDVDLCAEDPGKDVDLFLTSDVRALVEVWQGDTELRTELRDGRIVATGSDGLRKTISQWFPLCSYAHIKSVV